MKMKSARLLALLGILMGAGLPSLSSADLPPCPGSCNAVIYYCLAVCPTPSQPITGSTGQQCRAADGSVKDVYFVSCPNCASAACTHP